MYVEGQGRQGRSHNQNKTAQLSSECREFKPTPLTPYRVLSGDGASASPRVSPLRWWKRVVELASPCRKPSKALV